MLELISGSEVLDIDANGYYFYLVGMPLDVNAKTDDRAYSHGSELTSDGMIKGITITLEGDIVGTDAANYLTLRNALLDFLYNKTDVILRFETNSYYKIAKLSRVRSNFRGGSGNRADKITLELVLTDPFVYEFEPAYVMRFGDPEFWTEGRGCVYPESNLIATHRADGISGYSIAVEEATTNLLTANQADIETDTTGFMAVNAGGLSRVTTEHYNLLASLKCITPNAVTGEGFYAGITGALASKRYCGSLYLKGSGTVKIYLRDETNATNGTAVNITLSTTWTRYHCTHTTGAACAEVRLYCVTQSQQASTFYSDCLQIENHLYPTSWLAGAASRAAGECEWDIMDDCLEAEECTIFLSIQPDIHWDDGTTNNDNASITTECFFQYGVTDIAMTAGFLFRYDRSDANLYLRVYTTGIGNNVTYLTTGLLAGHDIAKIAIVLTPNTQALYINGALKASGSYAMTFPVEGTKLRLGQTYAASRGCSPNALLDEIAVIPAAYTAAQVAAVYSSFATAFPSRGWNAKLYSATGADVAEVSFTVTNSSLWPSYPIIRVLAVNDDKLFRIENYTDSVLQCIISDINMAVGQIAVIDSRLGTALRGSTDIISKMTGYFLKILAGANTMKYLGGDAEISVLWENKKV